MALILSIETATSVCSVALHQKEKLLATRAIDSDKSHSTLLLQFIEDVLNETATTLQSLDAIAISEGPGSYTGLRIGLSTAKGLCYALEKPLVAVNTLDALALQQSITAKDDTLVCPMIDARRMEVYTAVYNNRNERIQEIDNIILDETSFSKELNRNKMIFFGNGAKKFKSLTQHPNALFIDNITPRAEEIGILALKKFNQHHFEDVAYFEPNYLKEFYSPKPKNKTLLNLVRKS